MPSAAIRINTLVPPQDVPINTLVNLSNASTGGETTFNWILLDQPEGPLDILVPAGATATITPKKEGSYLLQLVVNAGTNTEVKDVQKFRIRDFVDDRSPPAAGETVQQNPTRGWAEEQNRRDQDITSLRKDPGRLAGQVAVAGTTAGVTVLYVSDTFEIKAGLPGAERVPVFSVATASTASAVRGSLFLLDRGVVSGGSPAANEIVWVRQDGMIYGAMLGGGAVGDPVYVDNLGAIALLPGAYHRNVGQIVAVRGAEVDIWFDGHRQVRQVGSLKRASSRGALTGVIGTTWPLNFGYETIPPTNGVDILNISAGDATKFYASKPGRWSRLVTWCVFNVDPRTLTVTAYKNGIAQALSVTLTTPGPAPIENIQTDYDEAHAFEWVAGDRVELVVRNDTAILAYNDINGISATVYEQIFD